MSRKTLWDLHNRAMVIYRRHSIVLLALAALALSGCDPNCPFG
jgi:hypothetical protein